MSTLTITTTYDTAAILYESQLDAIKTPIETYFNTTQIEGNNIQANILDGATYLADDSISADKLASNSVTTAKLADSTPSSDTGITTAKINTDAITTAKLDDLAVTTAKIDDGDVTTAKIGGAVPKSIMLELPTASATLSDLTITRTASSDPTTNGSETLVGSLTFSGLTSGKPVLINLQSTSTSSGYGYIEQVFRGAVYGSFTDAPLQTSSDFITHACECELILKKDSSAVSTQRLALGDIYGTTLYFRVPLSVFNYIDIASSTSHTYSLYIRYIGVTLTSFPPPDWNTIEFRISTVIPSTTTVNSAKLVAIQLV